MGTGAIVEPHDVDYVDPAGIYVNGNRVNDVFAKKGPNADCSASSCTETYTYDGRDRLTQEQRTPGPTINFTLDPAGNVTKKVTPHSPRSSPTRASAKPRNWQLDGW